MEKNIPFSKELEQSIQSGKIKNIGDLEDAFGEKSFAMLFLVMMFIPSLPIPTGGVTHLILLPIVWIASVEMLFGRRSLWFPNFIRRLQLKQSTTDKALPFMVRRIRWFERFSRPRLSNFLTTVWFRTFTAIIMLLLALAAFIAPPFSGLDTLPALGAVIISLSMILEDILLFFIGLIVGAAGIGAIIATAGLITAFFNNYF